MLRRGRPRRVKPVPAETIRGLEDAVHEQGCAVVVCSTDGSPDREARYLRLLEEQRVQGIVITPATRSIHHLETLRDRAPSSSCSTGAAATASSVPSRSTTPAAANWRRGTVRARSPTDRVHQRAAPPVAMRRAAARNAQSRTSGGARRRREHRRVHDRPDHGVRAGGAGSRRVPRSSRSADCRGVRQRPGRVHGPRGPGRAARPRPRDVSVVGYDDVDFAEMLSPALTSIRQPKYELGRAAAELLIAETVDPLHRHGDIRFEPELIARQSTTARAKLNRYSPGAPESPSAPGVASQRGDGAGPASIATVTPGGGGPTRRPVPDEDSRGTVEQLVYEMEAHGVARRSSCARRSTTTPTTSRTWRSPASVSPPGSTRWPTWTAGGARPTTRRGRPAGCGRWPSATRLAGFTHYVEDRNDGWLRATKPMSSCPRGRAKADREHRCRACPGRPTSGSSRAGTRTSPSCAMSSADAERRTASIRRISPRCWRRRRIPNVYLKVSGLHCSSARPWDYPWPDGHRAVRAPVRCLWTGAALLGLRFPASTRYCTFRQSIEAVRTTARS